MSARRIMIVAGEASGDLHGANLVKALKEADPAVEVFGVGGHRMREAGVDVCFDSSLVAVVGGSEVIRHLDTILGVMRWLKEALHTLKPDLVILIDFPDFNFRIADAAKRARVPVFYYISPQIWAWRKGRAKFLARTVAGMAVIFPFEAELYRKWGLPAEYVGHPILDGRLGAVPSKAESRAALGIPGDRTVVALLPGSRRSEIAHHLDLVVESARRIAREVPDVEFLMPLAPTLDEKDLRARLGGAPIRLVTGDAIDVLAAADAAVVKSGTSTVEAALCGVPFVIVYRLSRFTFALGRLLIKVPFIGMANLIAGKRIAPELVQHDFTPEKVAREVVALLSDRTRREEAIAGCRLVREKMGGPGASRRAAEMALSVLARRAA